MSSGSTQTKSSGPARRSIGVVMAPVVIFAALAGMFAFALQKGDPSRLPSALIGKPSPRVELAPLEDLTEAGQAMPGISAGDLAAGTPAVVNFFASWCGPCVEEHPLLLRLKERAGVRILGVNYKDQAVNARRFLSRYGNPYTRVGVDRDGRAAIEWGVYGMPETFVIDGKGTIVFKHVGPLTPDVLEQRLLPAIERVKGKS